MGRQQTVVAHIENRTLGRRNNHMAKGTCLCFDACLIEQQIATIMQKFLTVKGSKARQLALTEVIKRIF